MKVPEEQKAIQLATRLRDRGKSYRETARALEAKGYAPKGRGPWHPIQVKRLLGRAA